MPAPRLPSVGGDLNNWGQVLNNYLAMVAGINVLDGQWAGGADPTGTGDSWPAIQAALNAANTAYSATVFVPPGVYLISQTLQIGSSTILAGSGLGSTTIKAQNGFAASQVAGNGGMCMIVTFGDGGTAQPNITVTGLTLDMNEANVGTGGSLPGYASQLRSSPMSFKNVTNLTVSNVQVINAVGYSLFPQNCATVIISGCVITSGQTTVLSNASQDCIHVMDCTGVVISGNILQSGTHGGDDPIAIQGIVTGSSDVAITGNVILASGTHGITTNIATASCGYVTITGNTIANCQQEGILVAYYSPWTAGSLNHDITISGNVIRNSALAGTGRSVSLNDGTNVGHTGSAGWKNVTITGNEFDGQLYCGAGSGLTILGNKFRPVVAARGFQIGDNIAATSCTVTNFTVIGNTVDMSANAASSPAGIVVCDSADGTVEGNTVIGPGTGVTGGIGIWPVGVGLPVTGLAVNDNRVTGWAAAITESNSGAQPDYNTFVGNNCHGNTAFIATGGTHDVTASNVVA